MCVCVGACMCACVCVCVTGQQKGTKWAQHITKYSISQNDTDLEYCVQYLLSVSRMILPMELLIHGNNFTLYKSSYDATNVKNVVKFCVPTWSIITGPVT